MTKDENRYLREWVAFHRTQGYTKFYIYDNMSETPVSETLAREVSAGLVEVTLWEDDKVGRHHRAMDRFLDRRDVETVWASLTDTDEFAYGVDRPLSEVLKNHEDESAVKLKWLCFGSSGHDSRPEGLVIESYKSCGTPESIPGGKSIVKFGEVRRMGDCHNPRHPHKAKLLPQSEALINHYITRSKEDWQGKSKRGGGNGAKRRIRLFNALDIKTGDNDDQKILKYAKATKNNMRSN